MSVEELFDVFIDTGMSPSEAMSQVLESTNDPATGKPYLPFDIEQLTSELELRESNVSKLQNDSASKLGTFVTDNAEMARLGIEGGETEWEKYYYNRAQYAYAAMIRNWLENDAFCKP